MDLGLTREQRAVREAFAALFGKQATPERVRRAERSPSMGFDQLLWRHYVDIGALGIGVPSDCGGGDGGLLELALVAEEAGRRLAPIPVAETAAAARMLGRLREKELLVPVLGGSLIVSLATLPGPLAKQMLVDGAIADAVLALDGDSLVYVIRPDGLPKTPRRNLGGLPLGRWDAPGATTVLAEGSEACAAFDAAGVRPDDLRTLADLAKFPFTVKTDLRDHYPFGMFAVPRERVARIHASSGTTGRPTVVGYTAKDIDTWATVMARSIRAAGGRAGDIVHVAYGYGLFTGGLGAHYGAEKLGCTVIPMSGGMTERQVQLIVDFKPDIIMVTPSYMLAIAEEMERQRVDARQTSLRIGIFGAEPWTPAMRQAIEAKLDIDAIDIYGLSEIMGPGVAQECIETKDGLTIWEDHFYPEIVDPQTGAVVAEGERGELVFTSLTKEALPMIRYRTRDLTRLLPPSARSMRRMEKITGRCDDMLIIRGVNVFPTQVEDLILKQPELTPHYLLEITRPGSLDEMTVHVEMCTQLARGGQESRQAAAKSLEQNIKGYIGVSTTVLLALPGGIERSVGKAKRVVDKRPKG